MGIHQKSEITYVSMAYRCEYETRALGEDYMELLKIGRAWALLRKRIETVMPKLYAKDAKESVQELSQVLPDVFNDASWDKLLLRAQEAFDEADVRRLHRIVERAVIDPPPLAPDICPACGMDLDELNTSKNARDRGDKSCDRCEMILERDEADERGAIDFTTGQPA